MRLVFMGSPPFGAPVLQHLLDSEHEVYGVVTPPDRPHGRGRKVRPSAVVKLAEESDTRLLQPSSTRDPEFHAQLAALEPQALLVASYGEILRQDILNLAPRGAFNIHASLLPRWRGAAPIQHAILAGDDESGVSVQRMVLALDEGPVMLESRTPIADQENAGQLLLRLAELGGAAAVEAMTLLELGDPPLTPQDHSAASYAPKVHKGDGDLDWSGSAPDLARRVRAFTPWPGARTHLPDGRTLGILEAHVEPGLVGPPGTLAADARRLVVHAGSGGALLLLSVKPAGKGPMSGDSFLRGTRLTPGARLGAD